jgi:hypothetical protein
MRKTLMLFSGSSGINRAKKIKDSLHYRYGWLGIKFEIEPDFSGSDFALDAHIIAEKMFDRTAAEMLLLICEAYCSGYVDGEAK